MLTQTREPGLGIEEYRSTEDGRSAARNGLKQGLMLTSGFASSQSHFHFANHGAAEFRYLGTQTLDGREVYVVAFAQKPETAKMVTRFVMENRSALALIQGFARIDAEAFRIRRLNTYLLNPLPDIRLLKLTTEIQFQDFPFEGKAEPLRLPAQVDILVDWRGRTLHNRHDYSDYRLFSVESTEQWKPPVQKP
jgi:hypothetical protein